MSNDPWTHTHTLMLFEATPTRSPSFSVIQSDPGDLFSVWTVNPQTLCIEVSSAQTLTSDLFSPAAGSESVYSPDYLFFCL